MHLGFCPFRNPSFFTLWAALSPVLTLAQADNTPAEPTVDLPPVTISAVQVALDEPVVTFAQPVSWLRFEPRVDLQARNLPEAQADLTIRGGIFEDAAFRVGAAVLFDPQSGHYFAEIPIPASMLTRPEVLTGVDSAAATFNAATGTLAYGWMPVRDRATLSTGIGTNALFRTKAEAAHTFELGSGTLGVEATFAYSEADGTRPFGDHVFTRYAARLQYRAGIHQTDLFAGYQSKFFGWPYLYAPQTLHDSLASAGFATGSGAETENLQTRLFLLNHRWTGDEGSFLEATFYYRQHTDDYEFDRLLPGLFNPYQHESDVLSAALHGRLGSGPGKVAFHLQLLRDELASTALTFGPFLERDYLRFSLLPEWTFTLADDRTITLQAGGTVDTTSEDGTALSPLVRAIYRQAPLTAYAEVSGVSRVSGYTALGSNPNGGLFRGNPHLGRERVTAYEVGLETPGPMGTHWAAALFHRVEENRVDWVFPSATPNASRLARTLDIDVTGLELIANKRLDSWEIYAGYQFLDKGPTFAPGAGEDASFYHLNYAEHRLTLGLIARLPASLELRSDSSWRVQADNLLRTGTSHPLLTSLALLWRVPWEAVAMEATVAADNLWNVNYEEVPGVPGAGRQLSASLRLSF